MKTPEQIIKEAKIPNIISENDLVEVIKASQRDALECVRQDIAKLHIQIGKQLQISDIYQQINNLMP